MSISVSVSPQVWMLPTLKNILNIVRKLAPRFGKMKTGDQYRTVPSA